MLSKFNVLEQGQSCTRIICTLVSSSLVSFFLCVEAPATSVPHQLFGKSVTISRTFQYVFEDETTGKIITAYNQFTNDLYFSAAGRIFVRSLNRNQFGSSTSEQIGSDLNKVQRATRTTGAAQRLQGTGAGTFQDLQFEGRTLIAIYRVGENSAIRLAIEFNRNFGTCIVSVSRGTDDGKPERLIGWDGHVHRFISSKRTSQPSCEMRDGNIFE